MKGLKYTATADGGKLLVGANPMNASSTIMAASLHRERRRIRGREASRVARQTRGGTDWDLAPDGKRVVVVTPVESAEAPKQEHEVVFLENFFDELRRRAPADKK